MSNRTRKPHKPSSLAGLRPGLRMRGGVRYDPAVNGFVAIVHTWDNVLGAGQPDEEWRAPEVFPTEDAAMDYYKTHIRPALEKMAADASKSSVKAIHRKLE